MSYNIDDQYPQTIYANVLLLDNKIIDWKIGNTKRNNPMYWTIRRGLSSDQFDNLTGDSQEFIAENEHDKKAIFETLAPIWFEQWEHIEDYTGNFAYDLQAPKEPVTWEDKYSYQGWYVWKLNEFDWVCGKSLIEVLSWYKNEYAEDIEDSELTDSDLKLCKLSETVFDDDGEGRITFLDIIIEFGGVYQEPWIIACSER